MLSQEVIDVEPREEKELAGPAGEWGETTIGIGEETARGSNDARGVQELRLSGDERWERV